MKQPAPRSDGGRGDVGRPRDNLYEVARTGRGRIDRQDQ
jgi:hypothetical protein